MESGRKRSIKRAKPFTEVQQKEHLRLTGIAEEIRKYRERTDVSFKKLQLGLFKGSVGASDIHWYLTNPETLYQARPKTREAFEQAARALRSLNCQVCSFYDLFESRISKRSRRREFADFVGEYRLFRYADDGKSIAEYSASMFECSDCDRPRMRWLAHDAKHRVSSAERHGFVFVLSNRLHVFGVDVDRVLMLYLRRPDLLEAPLTGLMLNMHKDRDVPIATKILLCKVEALDQVLQNVAELLQNESGNPNILLGWRNRLHR